MCPLDVSDAVWNGDLEYIIENYENFNPNCYVDML
jgi:hypothetical protein